MKLPDGPTQSGLARRIRVMGWIFDPLAVLDGLQRQYGDIFQVNQNIYPPMIYFNHPEAIQQIFTAPPDTFESRGGNTIIKAIVGENSLLLMDGEQHRRQRKLLIPPFHGERMRAYGQLIQEITQQVIRQWQMGEVFPVRIATQDIALRVILSAVFGLDSGERSQKLRKLLSEMLELFNSPISSSVLFFNVLKKDWGDWSPWGKFLRRKQQIDQLLIEEIQTARQQENSNRKDILSLLVAARDEAGQPMSDAEIKDELMTLLLAGHETTASALAWAFYWIDQLPEVQDKLLYELNSLPPNTEPIEIAQLPYLSAICSETLRIYPIAITPFARISKSPMEILGYQLPARTGILISIYLVHHRSDIYPEPDKFKPERFLERQFSPYEYLPFGGGNRRCIGEAFSLFEMKLVLATILSECQLQRVGHGKIKPVRRGLTVAPPRNLRMKKIPKL